MFGVLYHMHSWGKSGKLTMLQSGQAQTLSDITLVLGVNVAGVADVGQVDRHDAEAASLQYEVQRLQRAVDRLLEQIATRRRQRMAPDPEQPVEVDAGGTGGVVHEVRAERGHHGPRGGTEAVGVHGHLAAAARRIDHILRDGIARRVATQRLHHVEAAPHAGAQVRAAGDEVALVDVIGAHPADEELLHERLHHHGVVVHALQEDGLVAQRDAGQGKSLAGRGELAGDFLRVVGMDAQPHRTMPTEDLRQLGRNPLGEEDRDTGAQADELDVRDGAQAGEQGVQLGVGEQQRVPAG